MFTKFQSAPIPQAVVAKPTGRSQVTSTQFTAADECLVVSPHADRRQMLAEAASDAGWEAVVCEQPQEWVEFLSGHDVQLCLLDLQDCDLVQLQQYQQLAARITSDSTCLLIVCGNPGDPHEELWARQAGAWLYLPGVEPDCDLTSLCREAQQVTARLRGRPIESTS